MRFAQLALAAIVGLGGVSAHVGHEVVQPIYPERRDTLEMRARPVFPEFNENPSLSARGLLKASVDGSCGISSTCEGSRFGACCSKDGWCGSSPASCGDGCREGFGRCDAPVIAARQAATDSACDAPTTTAAAATTTRAATTTTPAQQTTTSATRTTTAPAAATTTAAAALKVSKDGKCGASVGQTCAGSSIFIGPCCSASGRCGVLGCLRLLGCQTKYGKCI